VVSELLGRQRTGGFPVGLPSGIADEDGDSPQVAQFGRSLAERLTVLSKEDDGRSLFEEGARRFDIDAHGGCDHWT
jgi:hypothetical protein